MSTFTNEVNNHLDVGQVDGDKQLATKEAHEAGQKLIHDASPTSFTVSKMERGNAESGHIDCPPLFGKAGAEAPVGPGNDLKK